MVGLSIPDAKKTRYILSNCARLLARRRMGLRRGWPPAVPSEECAIRSVPLPLAACRSVHRGFRTRLLWLPVRHQRAGFATPARMCPAAHSSRRHSRLTPPAMVRWRDILPMPLAASAFIVFLIGIADPMIVARESSSSFIHDLEAVRQARCGDLVFFRMGPDGEDVKYASNLDYPDRPVIRLVHRRGDP